MERIRRSLNEQPQRKGLPLSLGILLGLGAMVVAFGWLAWPRGPSADNTRATPTPASIAPAPRAELVRLNPNVPRAALVSLGTPLVQEYVQEGESFWVHMPDRRWIVATAMGRAKSQEELPLTGNRIGDARWIDPHYFIWLKPIGQTSATWIDP